MEIIFLRFRKFRKKYLYEELLPSAVLSNKVEIPCDMTVKYLYYVGGQP